MTISPRQAKLLHSALIAFMMGVLTALQIGLTTGLNSKKAILALLVGALGGGLSRVAGALVAWFDAPPS